MKSGNLANLGRAGQLAAESTSVGEIGRLLKSADDQLRDSGIKSVSAAGRFMLAYNAVHALALAALRAEGYRPSASRGHRKLIFQVLETTAGAPRDLWVALDSYHDRRNAAEYQGAPPATEAEAKDLVELAGKLQKLVLARLKRSHPELLK
ncbi:MAG TPA: hypothetical protein VF871_02505 [Burkholderiales bacterium]